MNDFVQHDCSLDSVRVHQEARNILPENLVELSDDWLTLLLDEGPGGRVVVGLQQLTIQPERQVETLRQQFFLLYLTPRAVLPRTVHPHRMRTSITDVVVDSLYLRPHLLDSRPLIPPHAE